MTVADGQLLATPMPPTPIAWSAVPGFLVLIAVVALALVIQNRRK